MVALPKHHSTLTREQAQSLKDAGYTFSMPTLYAVTDRQHGQYKSVYYVKLGQDVRPFIIQPPVKKS